MRYMLKENIEVDFLNQRKIAQILGINEVTLSNILRRKVTTNKPTAFFIVYLNGGTLNDIDKYFDLVR